MSNASADVKSVLSASLMLGLLVFAPAYAQAPSPAAPAAGQQAPRRPAAPPHAQPQRQQAPKPREISGVTLGWIRHCAEVGTPPALACVTQQEVRDESGNFVISLALQEPAGAARKRLAIGVPLGGWLPSELTLRVDEGKRFDARYGTCLSNGCFAALDATPELIRQMRAGKTAIVTISDANNLPVDVSMPLESFQKALDGSPANIAESEDLHRQWVGSLQARAQAKQRQSLEGGQAATQQPAPVAVDPPKN